MMFHYSLICMLCALTTESPTILTRPEPFVVGLQDVTTTRRPTFTCMVGGAPRPTLSWTYIPNLDTSRREFVLNPQSKDYNIIYNETVQNNGRSVVTSTLTFRSINNTDGGIVRCNTGSNPVSATADALLTVLGRCTIGRPKISGCDAPLLMSEQD